MSDAVTKPSDGQDILVQLCTFSADELRWKPVGGADETVAVKLLTASGGARSLVLGERTLALADVRHVASLAPGFASVQAKELGHIGLRCADAAAFEVFIKDLHGCKADYERFEQYDQSSVQSYFQYYAKLGNQQNMLQDATRTSMYRDSITCNTTDFKSAKVMDVGAGSGILSFFSCQAGASVVYAVEASSAAETIRALAEANRSNLGDADVRVVNKPLEAIGDEVSGKVDVLVSEPIGTFLFNERMIETYLCARDRFLKPGGKMFPNVGNLCIAPFSDAVLHSEQAGKCAFWRNSDFYGLDLNAAVPRSTREHFTQPIVDYINPECLVSEFITTRFDFMTATVESLQNIEIPFSFPITSPCLVHGLAGWFDAVFEGSDATVILSTAPWCPGTHWYQIRFLLETPLAVNGGQIIEGRLTMEANNLQSYYIKICMGIKGTEIVSMAERIDLKDPEYRFFTSASTYVPPGTAGVFGQQPGVATVEAPQTSAQVTWGQPVPQQQQQQQVADCTASSGAPRSSGGPTRHGQQVSGVRYNTRSRSASRRVR